MASPALGRPLSSEKTKSREGNHHVSIWIAVHSLAPPLSVAWRLPFLLPHPPWQRDRVATS